jgi:hypothetical protein
MTKTGKNGILKNSAQRWFDSPNSDTCAKNERGY